MFKEQEEQFRKGKEEIPFNGNWLNEENEIVTCDVPNNVTVFRKILELPDIALPSMSHSEMETVRGLALKTGETEEEPILVQLFSPSQLLVSKKRFALGHTDGTYVRFSSGFQLSSKLVCVMENGIIKFHSFYALSRVIETSEILSSATESEINSFAEDCSDILHIADMENFLRKTDAGSRKLITSLIKSQALENHTTQSLLEIAQKVEMLIEVQNDRIVVPENAKGIKDLLRFLNDGRYIGPISNKPYETNSRKPVS